MYSSIYYYKNLMNPVFSYENNNDGAYMNEQCDLHEITLYNSNNDENMIYMLLFFYLLSCYMATFYMYKYGVFNVYDDDDNDVSVEHIEKYEDKYYDSFKRLESRNLDDVQIQNMMNNIIWENTPNGYVIMYYDSNNESFSYYCNNKNISYQYLETVARKYAITYNCKELLIDMKIQIKNEKDRLEKQNEVEQKAEQKNATSETGGSAISIKNKSNIFASLKNYKTKPNSNKTKTNSNKTNSNKSSNTLDNNIVIESANRYSYCGAIQEYDILNKQSYKKLNDKTKQKMDYQSFKRQLLNK